MRVKITLFSILFLIACSRNMNRLTILFDRVDHLEVGSEVKIYGVIVGKVTDLDLVDSGVLVKLSIKKESKIPVGSVFTIERSLIGSASIIVQPSTQTAFLTASDTAIGKYSEKKLLDEFVADSARKEKIRVAIEKISSGLRDLIDPVKDSVK